MKPNAQQVHIKLLTLIMAGVASASFAAAATAAKSDTRTNANMDAGTHVSVPDTSQTDRTADTIKNPSGNARSQRGASPSSDSMSTDNDASKPSSGADMKAAGNKPN